MKTIYFVGLRDSCDRQGIDLARSEQWLWNVVL